MQLRLFFLLLLLPERKNFLIDQAVICKDVGTFAFTFTTQHNTTQLAALWTQHWFMLHFETRPAPPHQIHFLSVEFVNVEPNMSPRRSAQYCLLQFFKTSAPHHLSNNTKNHFLLCFCAPRQITISAFSLLADASFASEFLCSSTNFASRATSR